MVKQNIGNSWILSLQAGFTLVELLVVIGVVGIIAGLSFYGMRNFDTSQVVANAQKDFVSNFRSAQNRVNSGNGGNVVTVSSSSNDSYIIGSNTFSLPNGVSISAKACVGCISLDLSQTRICIANPNLSAFDSNVPSNACGGCSSGNTYFSCISSTTYLNMPTSDPIIFYFTKGTEMKSVKIEGNGMTISRIYEL